MKIPARYFPIAVAAMLGAAMQPALAHADIHGFGDFSNFSINNGDGKAAPTVSVSAGSIDLGNGLTQRSIFCDTPQTITKFTASFSYVTTDGSAGACLVAENAPLGPSSVGGADGYSGITNSFAISLDDNDAVPASDLNTTSLFTNGLLGGGGSASVSPINFSSGDRIDVTLVYNGSILNETIQDATTAASFNTAYVTNLASFVGGPTAYIGLTGGSITSGSGQTFSNFQFITGPEPASLSLLAVAGVGLIARRRRSHRV